MSFCCFFMIPFMIVIGVDIKTLKRRINHLKQLPTLVTHRSRDYFMGDVTF